MEPRTTTTVTYDDGETREIVVNHDGTIHIWNEEHSRSIAFDARSLYHEYDGERHSLPPLKQP